MSKQLVVKPDGRGMYDVVMEGGGPVPKALSGKYTSYASGKQAISIFQGSVQDRVEGSGKNRA